MPESSRTGQVSGVAQATGGAYVLAVQPGGPVAEQGGGALRYGPASGRRRPYAACLGVKEGDSVGRSSFYL